MTHPKPSNSSFRYLIAGFKPLANIKVWGSVGIMALVALVLWQYYQHPERLGSDQLLNSTTDGEVEAEIGNSVDIGVTIQDLERNRLNSQEVPGTPSPLQPFNTSQEGINNNPNPSLLSPSGDGDNKALDQPSASIKFQPLMPNVKNLGSLFPPLNPSKTADKPIKIPDTLQDRGQKTQNSALENALEEVFPQEPPSINPSNQPSPSQNNNRPLSNPPRTNSLPQSNYPTTATQGRNNPYPTQPYTQPNSPYNYRSPQPYSRPYGSGTAPAPVPAYPSPNQLPNNPNNSYGNTNPNPNYSTPPNQNQPTYNYGMQPPQINQYGGTGN